MTAKHDDNGGEPRRERRARERAERRGHEKRTRERLRPEEYAGLLLADPERLAQLDLTVLDTPNGGS